MFKAFNWKAILAQGHDIVMAAIALQVALVARYGFYDFLQQSGVAFWTIVFTVIAFFALWFFNVGRGIWRFASVEDLKAIVYASTTTVLLFVVLLFLLERLEGFPRGSIPAAWLSMICLLSGPRMLYRRFKGNRIRRQNRADLEALPAKPILVIGSAISADDIVRDLMQSNEFKILGIIDTKVKNKGRSVRGVPIIGHVDKFDSIISEMKKRHTIHGIVMGQDDERIGSLSRLAAVAVKHKISLMRLRSSGMSDMQTNLRALTFEDLFPRQTLSLDPEPVARLLTGSRVLITGAGGSIGSEIVDQVAGFRPARLILIEQSEFALYQIEQQLKDRHPNIVSSCILASVEDEERIAFIFNAEKPDFVFHAAALKHVPICELNPTEAVRTNIIGTQVVANAALAVHARAMVLISTDKSIRPASVMGATKQVAEAYCQALDVRPNGTTRFLTVRFGNVLGSSGSVVPLFRKQILSGGPLTVTDPKMTRFFMSVAEAVQLVLQAASVGLARDEQRGHIFVLEMGEPILIDDLARTMIALAGPQPSGAIEVVYTGLRQGEKLTEMLFDPGEKPEPSDVPGIQIARSVERSLEEVSADILAIAEAANRMDENLVRKLLKLSDVPAH